MNCHGNILKEFRGDFKFRVKYLIIDFGYSVQFDPGSRPEDRLIEPVALTREQRAPEMDGRTRIDPFAADVYATALLFYSYFQVSSPSLLFVRAQCGLRLKMSGYCSRCSWPLGAAARHVILQPHTSSDGRSST
jgi:hypothetical protein